MSRSLVIGLAVVGVVLLAAFVWLLATSKSRMKFHGDRVVSAAPDAAREAVKAMAAEELSGFALRETPDGWTGSGILGLHQTDAALTIEPSGTGAKVTIELSVLRSSSTGGYMLYDLGSFYDRHIRKWLADVESRCAKPPAH